MDTHRQTHTLATLYLWIFMEMSDPEKFPSLTFKTPLSLFGIEFIKPER